LLLGLLFSSCVGSIVGVISGVVPAMKASKMDCVEALKFE
jgi:ABC-type antimicrobial peptide transport system permease subunit